MTHEPDLAQLSYQAHERGYDDYQSGWGTSALDIAHYDRLCRLGINQWGLLGALMLKDNPTEALRSALERRGYELTVLPANPYLKGRPR